MADLVRVIETALADRWRDEGLHNSSDPEVDAYVALDAITKAGWRIVRTESVEASTDDGPDWFARVTDEWTPEVPS